MGRIVPVPLGPQSDPGRSPNAGTALLENCYVEALQGGKVPYALYPTPGVRLFTDIGGVGENRGLFALGNLLYSVSGEALYRVTSVGGKTLIGNVLGQNPVIFSPNRKQPDNQIVIVADTKVYVLEGSTLQLMPDLDLPAGVHSADYIAGVTAYGLNDARVFWSETNDATNIDPNHDTEAERYADNGVRIITVGTELWYFGAASLQPFITTGDPANFLRPQDAGGGQGSGSGAKHTVVIFDNTVVTVNDVGQVIRFSGYAPERISNHAVERDIQAAIDAGTVDQMTSYAYPREGHWFYILNMPNASWGYDAATKLWHRRKSYLRDNSKYRFFASAFGKMLVAEVGGNKIFELTPNAYDEDGEHLIMAVQSSILSGFPAGGTVNEVYIDCEMGLGSGTDPHSADPQFMMQYTKDGGHTWSSPRMRPLGAEGHYQGRVKYTRLGDFGPQGIAFRFSCSAPIKRAVLQAYADITPTRPR